MKFLKEACVETIDQCLKAEQQGADRIELCSDLQYDGLTPSKELIQEAKRKLSIPIRVMIRPRVGDFKYTQEEIERMKRSTDLCKENRVEGVVFGMTRNDGTVLDLDRIVELASYAKPLKVTIHKAIDGCSDPLEEIKKLLAVDKVDAVLTSGKSTTAEQGKGMLKQMIELADSRLEVIVCGKVTDQNVAALHKELHAHAYHGKRIVGQLSAR